MVALTEQLIVAKTRINTIHLIKNLNLWGSDLDNVDLVQRMPCLEVLSLSVNNISDLSVFAHCSQLQELYLRKNKVATLDQVLFLRPLDRLRVLWLSDNPCCQEDNYRLTILGYLPWLTKLDNIDVTPSELSSAQEWIRQQTSIFRKPRSNMSRQPSTQYQSVIAQQHHISHQQDDQSFYSVPETPLATQPILSPVHELVYDPSMRQSSSRASIQSFQSGARPNVAREQPYTQPYKTEQRQDLFESNDFQPNQNGDERRDPYDSVYVTQEQVPKTPQRIPVARYAPEQQRLESFRVPATPQSPRSDAFVRTDSHQQDLLPAASDLYYLQESSTSDTSIKDSQQLLEEGQRTPRTLWTRDADQMQKVNEMIRATHLTPTRDLNGDSNPYTVTALKTNNILMATLALCQELNQDDLKTVQREVHQLLTKAVK